MKRGIKYGKNFILRIDIPAVIAFMLFAGLIFIYLIPGFEKAIMDRKREMIKEVTSTAYSMLVYYHSRELASELGSEEARQEASAAIGRIRYGESMKDYFWITDLHPVMIVHPYRPELNGKDLTDFEDASGKRVFVDFVRSAGNGGEGYVSYMWQWNDDSTRTVPKLSYVRLFEPWGWVIGTGIYIDDVKTEIRRIEFRALIISAIIAVVIIALLTVISIQSHQIENKRAVAETELHRSRELYKALAEASREGVLIWSSAGLQANKVLLSWLDLTGDELRDLHPSLVLEKLDFVFPENSDSLYDNLDSARYTGAQIMTKTGSLINAHADFSRIEIGGRKAVIAVLTPVPVPKEAGSTIIQLSSADRSEKGFFRIAPGLFENEIAKAVTATELSAVFKGCRMLSASMILDGADPVAVSGFVSRIADSICKRVIEICLSESSRPPCSFAFIQTGSAGRMEQTLCTDQDNGIIISNAGADDIETSVAYFTELAVRINRMLEEAGYASCKGGNMASNPKWCRPLDDWKAYFSGWIKAPGPAELLDISIFFDIRHCYGDSSLTAELKDFIGRDLVATDIFFHHMALGWKEYLRAVHLSPDRKTDIKKIMMPLTGLVRLYALKNSVASTATGDRIADLHSAGTLPLKLLRSSLKAARDLTMLRLRHQAECIARGETADNLIDFASGHPELFPLAEQALSAVRDLMLQADADFYTSEI
ncbi:MAG: DUF294 nucleotidyltransferase-like domain-containing protein [Bacteroidales bacterium]|nr:DUF294 nucleotidyltransferase-like domain-containing protein [Bacteroidales bacterium]